MISSLPIVVIEQLLEYCYKNSSLIDVESVIDISSVGLEHVDEFETINKICNQLSQFGKGYFVHKKEKLALSIYNCFIKTNSDNVKKSLLRIVSELKIRREFKPFLKEQEELDYYTNNIKKL